MRKGLALTLLFVGVTFGVSIEEERDAILREDQFALPIKCESGPVCWWEGRKALEKGFKGRWILYMAKACHLHELKACLELARYYEYYANAPKEEFLREIKRGGRYTYAYKATVALSVPIYKDIVKAAKVPRYIINKAYYVFMARNFYGRAYMLTGKKEYSEKIRKMRKKYKEYKKLAYEIAGKDVLRNHRKISWEWKLAQNKFWGKPFRKITF